MKKFIRHAMNKISKYFLIIILISCFACSMNQSRYMGLLDQGILPLSTDNAFLGANIFLSKEIENDKNLESFFRSHGTPEAIEISKNGLFQEQLILYYLKEGSKYIGSNITDNNDNQSWIFRGAYKIPWNEGKKIQPLINAYEVPALLYVRGKYERYYKNGEEPKKEVINLVVHTPTTVVKKPPVRKIVRKSPQKRTVITNKPSTTNTVESKNNNINSSNVNEESALNPLDFYKLNAVLRALLLSKGYAARADNGDIIHIVKDDVETLSAIAKWYAGSEDKVADIAKQNGFDPNTKLSRGNQIRVPFNIIKNDKMMPSEIK